MGPTLGLLESFPEPELGRLLFCPEARGDLAVGKSVAILVGSAVKGEIGSGAGVPKDVSDESPLGVKLVILLGSAVTE